MALRKSTIIALAVSVLLCYFCFNVCAEELELDFPTTEASEEEDVFSDMDSDGIGILYDYNSQELKNYRKGRIVALNKTTANSSAMDLTLGKFQYFGNIQITLHKCVANLNPYAQDNYMLLTIVEHKLNEDPILLFQGWMLSSSVSLSTFEHPIYEIFAKECL